MHKEKLLKVLVSPHLSEKSAGQYIFKVAKTANKKTIKAAVEQLFQVKVKGVNVLNAKGIAITRFGRPQGRQASWKKGYVTLEAGEQINIGA